MDNKKIGKLIADLRKKKGLTQQELGDKVGVGFRAVSKWERGLTLPDISIINELSKILGISSDELLTGQIKKDNKSKEKKTIPPKVKITITLITSIIIILSSILIYYNNRIYEYNLASMNQEDYFVEGKIIFNKNRASIIINKVKFKDSEFALMKIKNYEYDIRTGEEFIFRYGYAPTTLNAEEFISIDEFTNQFNINHNTKNFSKRNYILDNNIILTLRFLDEKDDEIIKEIEIKLELKQIENN